MQHASNRGCSKGKEEHACDDTADGTSWALRSPLDEKCGATSHGGVGLGAVSVFDDESESESDVMIAGGSGTRSAAEYVVEDA